MTDEQRAIINEQNAVMRRAESDIRAAKARLELHTEDLKRAAEREIRQINLRANQRVRELGQEYKRLSESVGEAGR